jgi:hypothetical protein
MQVNQRRLFQALRLLLLGWFLKQIEAIPVEVAPDILFTKKRKEKA